MLDFENWTCPLPLRDTPDVVMGHGGGGAMSGELVRHLFLPAYGSSVEMTDSAVLPFPGGRLAFSTDSYVVKPMFFPGGSIGDLAVNGTVNDLAMSGARPLYLSTAFILQEGTPLATVARIAGDIGAAAQAAGVHLVTGDTKVVDRGSGDGVFVNTAGVGLVPAGADIRPSRAAVGDAVIISGDIGVHGVAVMSVRPGLEFTTSVTSDTAPLHSLVADILATGADVHVLRDPTRGGVAAALNEIAAASPVPHPSSTFLSPPGPSASPPASAPAAPGAPSATVVPPGPSATRAGIGILLSERDLPIPAGVLDACSLLGLDPLQVANEGKLIVFVPGADAERVLTAMRAHPYGRGARQIGTCVSDHPGMVVARTALGGTRVVTMPIGEQLPRIC